MSTGKPPWWRAFDKVERAIAGPLEEIAASNRYVDVMVRGLKVQRSVGGGVGRLVGGVSERVLKVANIPTRSDIRRLNKQLAVLTSEVRELSVVQREMKLAPMSAQANEPVRGSRSGTNESDDVT